MTTSALWEMFKFPGNMGKIYRFYPWAGVVTGPYSPQSRFFDSLPGNIIGPERFAPGR